MNGVTYVIYALVLGYPVWRIFKRTGKSGFYALLLLLPLGFIILLYILAYSNWPMVDQVEES